MCTGFFKQRDMLFVLVIVTVGMIKDYDQRKLWGTGFIWLRFYITVNHQRRLLQEHKQGKDLEADANAETMKGCYILVCSSWLALPASCRNHDNNPGVALPAVGWAFNNQ